jgi:signal transduction histidine kinase
MVNLFKNQQSFLTSSLESRLHNELEIVKLEILSEIKGIKSDLLYLSDSFPMKELLNTGRKDALDEDLISFSRNKGKYDQIRFLNNEGMEIVRINYNQGTPSVISASKIQNKADRYYFKDNISFSQKEVFVSPLDLNIEEGKIEQPPKPVIRFGTPVYDKEGRKRGIVLLNYLASNLLAKIRDNMILLNQEGYWLHGGDLQDRWGFMYGNDRTFATRFPSIWERIMQKDDGKGYTNNLLFSYVTVYPLRDDPGQIQKPNHEKKYFWKLIVMLSNRESASGVKTLRRTLENLFLIIIVSYLFISLFVSRTFLYRRLAVHRLRVREQELSVSNEELKRALSEVKRQTEARLLQAERLAAVGSTVTHIAHEIKNPLVVIGGFAKQLCKTPGLDEKSRQKLDIITKEVGHLETMVAEMRDFVRLPETRKTMGNINALLDETVEFFQEILKEHQIQVQRREEGPLPPLSFDVEQIRQVLINLLKNAMEAMLQGGTLTITTRTEGPNLEISFQDTGEGISPEVMANIFQPFYTTKTKGTGLGLPICQFIIEKQHCGHLKVESSPGYGSTFTIQLPQKEVEVI